MDAIDIMTNLHLVVPFYQAVFSADEHRVIGYEVLGRIKFNEEYRSLGAFFHDEAIPEEYRIEVDDIILHRALGHFIELENHPFLFINRDANLLMIDHGESLLELLLVYQEKGLALDRVVIELTEHNFTGDLERLNHLITYYRTYGLKIAVDNIGKESSNFDRIGLLNPDILKIDLKELLKTTTAQSYHDVLYSISLLARKIGATLLYEDVETSFQLQYAWKNGGRYYQGFLLHKPSEYLVADDIMKERLRDDTQVFIRHEKKKLYSVYDLSEQLNGTIQGLVQKYKKVEEYNELIMLLAVELNERCFRIYICDGDGFQQSANVIKEDQGWSVKEEYYFKNWSWRPYFLENIVRMKYNKKGILSDLYSDVESGETIRTFSYPLNNEHFLFIDIPYEFLFEHDGLL
ncbi:EAL domain-containing protein [Litchfieldia salsa]|uniref:EAL domain, c-di-GMP-specific phosphodiesterase class I (Or its enzymatically inactive variant) n=1 Tax=Litchfieldia salsa TaxID=930152 RepID=A0A1H0RL31_9BACI|nr:EAL-associated domain-containing protein [Litchfieldia salsa]SDP30185.1 EAL domain, c-di-GMP-specific phosphodiesterase class I (or its enzymatically inactive variant) [Litchfieldia salsa]